MREYTALPFEYLEEMDVLSDAEYGRLIRALQEYSMSGQEPELNGTEKVYWKRVRNRENRYREGFEDQDRAKSERALKAANARWSKSWYSVLAGRAGQTASSDVIRAGRIHRVFSAKEQKHGSVAGKAQLQAYCPQG